jgi:transketolase
MNNIENDLLVSTRFAYGQSLVELGEINKQLVVLDAGVSNSTYTELFEKRFPDRFFKMFIAEQNMIGVATGMALSGVIPFASSFGAFLSRSHDQLRMACYSNANIKVCGSHCGVSIGVDGFSQMALEDLAMFRSLYNSVVLYPSDAVSAFALTKLALEHKGLVYLRTTREKTPIIYDKTDKFKIGGLQVIKKSNNDKVAVIASGITLHEAIKAYKIAQKQKIDIRIIDLYSIKPIDNDLLLKSLNGLRKIITVEDHYKEGGLGEAIQSSLINKGFHIETLSVNKLPMSGQCEQLLAYEEIDSDAIVKKIKLLL